MLVWPWQLFLLAGQQHAAENPSMVRAPVTGPGLWTVNTAASAVLQQAAEYVYPAMTEDGWAVEEWRPLNKVSVPKNSPEAQRWSAVLSDSHASRSRWHSQIAGIRISLCFSSLVEELAL